MKFKKSLLSLSILTSLSGCNLGNDYHFNRVSTYAVCHQIEATCNTDTETSAEIVAASRDGKTLIYTDSPSEQIGFVDISKVEEPTGLGVLPLPGEPTSVAVKNKYALVAVNTSADFVNVSGQLVVVDIDKQKIVSSLALSGQPDSIAVSPNGRYAAIIIENERDEDLGSGEPPQAPAGTMDIISLQGKPSKWAVSSEDLTGIADLFPGDPEPEFVDINRDNKAVISMQENNYLAIIDLEAPAGSRIINHFSAGSVDLTQVDLTEGKPLQISQTENQSNVSREPDGVAWIDRTHFVTANEGDLYGGSRGFSVFNTDGDIIFDSGHLLDHLAAKYGHYPDKRSANKGNEPENVEVGQFGPDKVLFVNSERSNLVFVFKINDPANPEFIQALPAAVGPEGALAIPSRRLLVVASEKDNRGDKMRGGLNIYKTQKEEARYPTLQSVNRIDGTPIPWGAMSGLSADLDNSTTLYSLEDSFYKANRIFKIDISKKPAELVEEISIKDSNDVFAAFPAVDLTNTTVAADDATRIDVFDDVDLDNMINDDKTVNIDGEGVAKASDGGFWVASEGNGTIGDAGRPINSLNFIFKTDVNGVIENVISLPDAINNKQLRFGFEGVTEYNGNVYVAFQRVWSGDTNVRIGVYDTTNETWSFLYYPLETPVSQNGGWVGLSDITSLGEGKFMVIERDNQGGPDAAIKRLYSFDVTGLAAESTVTKTLVRDLMDDLAETGGLTIEKVEGSAVTPDGTVYIINDNDGVDDNSGETELLNLGKLDD